MSKEKFNIELIEGKLKEIFLKYDVLNNYIVSSKFFRQVKAPSVVDEYNFNFISNEKDRWLFITIQDNFKNQKLIIILNKLNIKAPVNINIEDYFVGELNIKSTKQKMIFKAENEEEMGDRMESVFNFLVAELDSKLSAILNGEDWLDMPFDWMGYK